MKKKPDYTTFRVGSSHVKRARAAAKASRRTVRAFIEIAIDHEIENQLSSKL